MNTLPQEAVKAATDVLAEVKKNAGWRLMEPNSDTVAQMLTAAIPFLPVQGAVKKLEWSKGVVDIAQPQPGMKYVACSTTPKGSWAFWLDHAPETRAVFTSEEAAKAAAQQDYSARILSALEPSAARELALAEAAQVAEDYVQYDVAAAIRTLSSPDHADAGKVEGDGWLPIETAPKDKTSVIIAVPTKDKDGFIVGEAYFDPENYEGGDWWWAGTAYTDHFDSPISEINHHSPTHWRPLPSAPASEGAE